MYLPLTPWQQRETRPYAPPHIIATTEGGFAGFDVATTTNHTHVFAGDTALTM